MKSAQNRCAIRKCHFVAITGLVTWRCKRLEVACPLYKPSINMKCTAYILTASALQMNSIISYCAILLRKVPLILYFLLRLLVYL